MIGSYPSIMLSPRSSTNTSNDDSSGNTNHAIIAGAVIGSTCILGLLFMWCFLWRRRNLQLKGDEEDRQRELESMYPHRSETIRATTEFQWPARVGETSTRLAQLRHSQENPEKEVYLSSTTSFPKPSTPMSVYQKSEYHISPQPFPSELYKLHEQRQSDLKLKNPDPSMYQPELAELPPNQMPEPFHGQPQELPAPTPPPFVAHELECKLRSGTPVERTQVAHHR